MPALPALAMTIAQMRDHRRVLVIAAPSASDPGRRQQDHAIRAASAGSALGDRDVMVVEVAGNQVTGASDPAASLRARYHLPSPRFGVILIGKDGHVAYRSVKPVGVGTIIGTIDAMPMRRAGQR